MDVDPQEHQTDMAANHIEQVDQSEQDVTMMATDDGSLTSRGDVLKILGQTIHDGGAVKYTVFWENGESTEVRLSARVPCWDGGSSGERALYQLEMLEI